MPVHEVSPSYEVAIVSCDIVGHSSVRDQDLQFARVAAINDIMAETIAGLAPDAAVWASGGDGGHLVFRTDAWRPPAVALISRLKRWSAERAVPLRVTAHVGTVTHLRGADGRIQIVGDGINVAGWLLSRGAAAGVVVTEAFRLALCAAGAPDGTVFHDERSLRTKGGEPALLMLMSTPGVVSGWDLPTAEERGLLEKLVGGGSLRADSGWEVVYLAKRILQINQADETAVTALHLLSRRHLTYHRDGLDEGNPLFEFLGPTMMRDIVRAGHLVERRYNEYICRYGDQGDTMFVILRGQVGVYLPEPDGASAANTAAFIHQEGEIVGELAFALSRTRTADLVALTDTALLSFSFDDISSKLTSSRSGRKTVAQVTDFITSRVLEHVSRKLPYLVGPDHAGPLSLAPGGWRNALAMLHEDCDLITVNPENLLLDFVTVAEACPDAGAGVYLLTSGAVCSDAENSRMLRGDEFPLLWTDMPGVVVVPRQSFRIEEEPVKILYIRAQGFARLPARVREAVYRALRRATAACFDYDAFISYNSGDAATADRLTHALEKHGLRVFRDIPNVGTEFPPRLWAAIRQSRALVPLISPHVMVRASAENWVKREIDAHISYFETRRIYPVLLPGGRPEQVVSGYRPVEGDDEEAVVRELADALLALRDGRDDPPFSRSAKPDPE